MTKQTRTRTFTRLRITLEGSDPEIWRTLDIDAALSLRDLHDAIQLAMGWRMSHLHAFTDVDPMEMSRGLPRIGRAARRWSEPDPFEEGPPSEPGEATTILEAFAFDGPLFYEYDFGDGWTHRIDLIERGAMDPHEPPVALVRGENRGPFEDSGGVPGFYEKLDALGDPTHPEHDDTARWVRLTVGPWTPLDPAHFDADAVQAEFNLRFAPAAAGTAAADMSGLVPAQPTADSVDESSPIVELTSMLPVPYRIELRGHLHRAGVLDDTPPDADSVERMMAPFRWLIESVGSDGLALTKAGWMPPATVLDGMTRLGWRDRWSGEANREDLTWPMRHFRASAQRMGIVRVYKGRLMLGAEAKKALARPELTWRLVTSRLLRGLDDAERHASTLLLLTIADGTYSARAAAIAAIGFGLGAIGWRPRDEDDFSADTIHALTARANHVLEDVGAYTGSWRRSAATDDGRAFARAALR
ncbi:plasmid pRiA4b ORF-3 family protein [Microbacterium sp. NPDC055357]